MHPVLYQTPWITFYSYGFFVALAVVVSLVIATRRAEFAGLTRNELADLVFLLFLSGILGARLFFVWQHFDEYRGRLWNIFFIQEGGLVWYGGFISAVIAGVLYAVFKKWRVLRLCDFFAPILPLGQAIGRLGCFFNGCCYGRLQGAFRHPTQIYESAGLVGLSIYLFAKAHSKIHKKGGALFVDYVLFYSFLRFVVEFFRGDQLPLFYLTLPQLMSLFLFLGMISLKKWRSLN